MTSKTITIREDIYKMLCSKSRSNIDKLKDLRGYVRLRNKEVLLKELYEKRRVPT